MNHSRLLIGLAMVAAARGPLRAQGAPVPSPYAEYRADALLARHATGELGAGLVIPMGIYVRTSLDAAAGATWANGATRAAARADAIARFLLDPFREVPIGVSAGGGVSLAYVDGDRVRPYLVGVIDVEGSAHRGFTPALEIGLGGGTRVGIVLRRSPERYR